MTTTPAAPARESLEVLRAQAALAEHAEMTAQFHRAQDAHATRHGVRVAQVLSLGPFTGDDYVVQLVERRDGTDVEYWTYTVAGVPGRDWLTSLEHALVRFVDVRTNTVRSDAHTWAMRLLTAPQD